MPITVSCKTILERFRNETLENYPGCDFEIGGYYTHEKVLFLIMVKFVVDAFRK